MTAPTLAYRVDTWRALMEVHAAVLRSAGVALAARHQLSVSEFDALVNIPRRGARHRDLTRRVILTQSALSRLLDRLEARGLIEGHAAVDDGRGVQILLTPAGAQLQRQAIRTNADVIDREFTSKLDPTEVATLHDIFDRLRPPPEVQE